MSISRFPGGATRAGANVGGQFAPVSGTRPPEGSLATATAGSFLYPPVSFASKAQYVAFWREEPIADTLLDRVMRAREKWRLPVIQAEREQLVARWEAQPRIKRMARRDPGFYADERNARATARGPEERNPPLPGELARPVAIAHQMWTRTALVPGMSRADIAGEIVPVPGDPNMTVQGIVETWRTEEWAGTAFGAIVG